VTRGCVIANCGRSPAKKAVCCGLKLCESHASSVKAHDCPRVAELNAMTKDQRRALLTGEEGITPALVDALNKLPEIEMAWQSRKRGGVRANDAARAVADVTFIARGGLHGEVELKGSHKDDCPCESCACQRDRAERIRGAGGVYIAGVRTVQGGIDGVRMGLARARRWPINQGSEAAP
jgi:hypothetical protein